MKQSNFFNLNLRDLASAVVSGVLVALLGALSNVTNIVDVDTKQILNVAILAAVTSLLKAILTTSEGKVVGAIKIK